MIISTNTLSEIESKLEDIDFLVYDFNDEEEHYLYTIDKDDFSSYQDSNCSYIVLYDKRRINNLFNKHSKLSNHISDMEKYNKSSMFCEEFIEKFVLSKESKEKEFLTLQNYNNIHKKLETFQQKRDKKRKEYIENLYTAFCGTPFFNHKELLQSMILKINNLDKDNIFDSDKLFYLKNEYSSINILYNCNYMDEYLTIKDRVEKWRDSDKYKDIDFELPSEFYRSMITFNDFILPIIKDKESKITDNRRYKKRNRLNTLYKIYKNKLINREELFYLLELNSDSISRNFRQYRFTQKSISRIKNHLSREIDIQNKFIKNNLLKKLEKEENKIKNKLIKNKINLLKKSIKDFVEENKEEDYKSLNVLNYESKINLLYKNSQLSKEEEEHLLSQDMEIILDTTMKDIVIEDLTDINDNDKRSKSIYTKLYRELTFFNLYSYEHHYSDCNYENTIRYIKEMNIYKSDKDIPFSKYSEKRDEERTKKRDIEEF
jgi:hypothetical protein